MARLMIWIVSGRCNLNCIHCYAARFAKQGELPTREAFKIIDGASEIGVTYISFTGGEPLLRPDIKELIVRAYESGYGMSLVTNGILINEEWTNFLSKYEVYVYLSVDGAQKETHEKIRGAGTWSKVIEVMKLFKKEGIEYSTIMALSKINYIEAKDYIKLVMSYGAEEACLIPVMPSGRAARKNLMIGKDEMASVIREVCEVASEYKYPVSLWCTPFGKLIASSPYVYFGGCRTFKIFDLDPQANILACDVLDFKIANVLKEGFRKAWERYCNDPLIKELVFPSLKEPCLSCELRHLCKGGCFARAYLIEGDYRKPDPLCPKVKQSL